MMRLVRNSKLVWVSFVVSSLTLAGCGEGARRGAESPGVTDSGSGLAMSSDLESELSLVSVDPYIDDSTFSRCVVIVSSNAELPSKPSCIPLEFPLDVVSAYPSQVVPGKFVFVYSMPIDWRMDSIKINEVATEYSENEHIALVLVPTLTKDDQIEIKLYSKTGEAMTCNETGIEVVC